MTELEKKVEAFADEVEAEIGHCCGDNLNISAAELAARLAPLLVEVCEQRAGAAELALRQANSEIATLNSQVFTGRDALQAKEQEMAQVAAWLINEVSGFGNDVVKGTEMLVLALRCELWSRNKCSCGLDELLRSLTPPPALTKEK